MRKLILSSLAVVALASCSFDTTSMPELIAGQEAAKNGIQCSRDFPEVDESDIFACSNGSQGIMVTTVVSSPDTDIQAYQQERPDFTFYTTDRGSDTYIVGVRK